MNPTKLQKSETGAPLKKNVQQAYIQPGALARGREQSSQLLGSLNVNVGKRTLAGESKEHNATAYNKKKLAKANLPMPLYIPSTEDVARITQDYEDIQDIGTILKNISATSIQPGAFARGRGKSFNTLGSSKGTSIGCNPAASNHTKPTQSNKHVPHGVDMEHDNFLTQEAEFKQEIGSALKNAMPQYIQPGALARGQGKNFNTLYSSKGTSIGCTSAASNHTKPTQSNKHVPHGVDMEDENFLTQEVEFTQEIRSALKNAMPQYIQPGALARGRGKSFNTLGSSKGTSIGFNPAASNHTKPTKSNKHVPHGVDIEDDNFLTQEAEFTQGMGSALKNAMPQYIQPGALARGRGKSFNTLGSSKGTSIGCNPAASPHNNPAQDDNHVPFSGVDMDNNNCPAQEGFLQDPCEPEKKKRVRGKNRNKDVARLKSGEKLKIKFYQNRVVGADHAKFSRHLGIIIRDCNMCPMRVHSWADIKEEKLEHMWGAVTDKFESDDMNDQREHVLRHMRNLWNNWRSTLHLSVKFKSLRDALKDVPQDVDKSDWEWLVKEHFLDPKFMETSARNSANRSMLKMPHRTGSKPIREIIYEMGGKDGNPPNMETIFFETHKKDGTLVEPETVQKYAEIQEVVQSEPSLTNIEVIERCFGPQNKSHVVGLGGGITTKELKGGSSSKAALLAELNATRKEKKSLESRVEDLESKYVSLLSLLQNQQSSQPSSSGQSTS